VQAWKQELSAFKVFYDEHTLFHETQSAQQLKQEWEAMAPELKQDFLCRVQAEERLVQLMQEGCSDYEAVSYYDRFLKHQLELMGGGGISKKGLRQLFYDVWPVQ
jgi:hypothetical protein